MYRNKERRSPKKELYYKHSLLNQKSCFFGLYAENIKKVRMLSVFTDPLIENFSNFEKSAFLQPSTIFFYFICFKRKKNYLRLSHV